MRCFLYMQRNMTTQILQPDWSGLMLTRARKTVKCGSSNVLSLQAAVSNVVCGSPGWKSNITLSHI